MKNLFILLSISFTLLSYAQETLPIEDAWKVDLSKVSDADRFWPEQRLQKEPVQMNSPEMDIKFKDLASLHKFDKKSFKDLVARYGDHQNNRVYISLEGADKSVLTLAAAASLGLIVFER